MRKQVVVEVAHTLLSHCQFRDVHYLLQIEMRDKLISVRSHFGQVAVEFRLCHPQFVKQAVEKRCGIGDNLLPVVLPARIAKELAPFQNADVEEVAANVHPKLIAEYEAPILPSCLVES